MASNVIQANFRPEITFKTEIIYCDEAVCLIRITYTFAGRILALQHVMAEMPSH